MNFKIVICVLVLFSTISINSQETLDADLVALTNLTLDKSPLIQRNELVIQNATGNIRVQRSVFDFNLFSSLSLANNKSYLFDADPRNTLVDDSTIQSNTSSFSLGLQRKFRFGLLASVSLDYDQFSDNFPFNQFNIDVGPDISDHNVSTSFSLTQPLFRGRGYKVNTALEKSSELQLESAENNFELNTSFELLQTATTYWQYLAAYKNLTIFQENEQRVRNVLNITEELVNADKKPAGDLEQIRADLANQERLTTIAEQNLYNAKLNLGDKNVSEFGLMFFEVVLLLSSAGGLFCCCRQLDAARLVMIGVVVGCFVVVVGCLDLRLRWRRSCLGEFFLVGVGFSFATLLMLLYRTRFR